MNCTLWITKPPLPSKYRSCTPVYDFKFSRYRNSMIPQGVYVLKADFSKSNTDKVIRFCIVWNCISWRVFVQKLGPYHISLKKKSWVGIVIVSYVMMTSLWHKDDVYRPEAQFFWNSWYFSIWNIILWLNIHKVT